MTFNYVSRLAVLGVLFMVFNSCKSTGGAQTSAMKDVPLLQIELVQLDRGENGYNPDPDMYYVWDSGTGTYHVEINQDGSQGAYWVDRIRHPFESGCKRNYSDISCSGSSWSFYAPMRMDAVRHIYGVGIFKPSHQQASAKIYLKQVEAADGNYNPDPGMYYLWDSDDIVYHVEASADGKTGAIWINQQKSMFSQCRMGTTDIICSGNGWQFTAPMRMDAPHHIFGAAILERQ
jgi:hypothetical protein